MRISYVSENKPLAQFLGSYESITLVNTYGNLLTEYDKFSNDLNKVDVFAIIEHSDLSGSLTAISRLIQSGSGYLLSAGEVLLVLNGGTERTQNRQDKVTAFTDILTEKGFKLRVVTPPVLDFTSIYNAFIKNTAVSESKIRVFTKYKVSRGDNGIALSPKKTNTKLVPDVRTGNKKDLKKIDDDTSKMLGKTKMDISERDDLIQRSVDNIIELPSIAELTGRVIFVTGVCDVGKTYSSLTFMDELSKNQISSLVIDSTGKDDIFYISQGNNFKAPILKGADLYTTKEQASVGAYLYKKAYSATFLNQLTHVSSNKNLIFCEVGLENLDTFVSSWGGDSSIIVVLKFDVTSILELKKNLTPNRPYLIYVNTDSDSVSAEEVKFLKQFLGEQIKVFNYTSRIDMFNSLGGA